MKKLIVFMLIVLLLCAINLNFVQKLDLQSLFKEASVEVYVNGIVDNNKYITAKNGEGEIIFTDIGELYYILNNYNVNGYTLKISKNLEEVLTILSPEKAVNKVYGCYGYKAGLGKGVYINNNYCNFQIVETGSCVLFGCPILLGSY